MPKAPTAVPIDKTYLTITTQQSIEIIKIPFLTFIFQFMYLSYSKMTVGGVIISLSQTKNIVQIKLNILARIRQD